MTIALGTPVRVTKGSYAGMSGTLRGTTPKQLKLELEDGRNVRLSKASVAHLTHDTRPLATEDTGLSQRKTKAPKASEAKLEGHPRAAGDAGDASVEETLEDEEHEEYKSLLWWRILSAIAICNMCFWAASAYHQGVLASAGSFEDRPYLRYHLALSGVFTFVCAFRSFWPRIDLERYCMTDDMLSSVVAGRSSAMCAEISYGIQCGLLLCQLSELAGLAWIAHVGMVVTACMTTAQCFCWYGLLTLKPMAHAYEESLWTVAIGLVGLCFGAALPTLTGEPQKVLWFYVGCCTVPACALFVAFMSLVDVPMYVARAREHTKNNEKTLGLADGFQDALYRRVVTMSWGVWRHEVAWLTGYFSCGVWCSIGMLYIT